MRPLLELRGECLDVVAAGEGVHGVRDARLVGEDLLRAERDPGGRSGRKSERLVVGVGVQRLGAAQDSRQRLQSDAHHVV